MDNNNSNNNNDDSNYNKFGREEMKDYKDYVIEIEELKKRYNLRSDQLLMLQIAAAFKVDKMDYDKLKKEFIDESSNILQS